MSISNINGTIYRVNELDVTVYLMINNSEIESRIPIELFPNDFPLRYGESFNLILNSAEKDEHNLAVSTRVPSDLANLDYLSKIEKIISEL